MDPYALGYLCGSITLPAIIGYWVGRKLVGPSGTGEVERLQQIAGLAEPGAKSPSRFRGAVPYLLALGGALVGLVSGAHSLIQKGNGPIDPVKLEQGFLSGCSGSCSHSNAQICNEFCTCVLGRLKERHHTAEDLKNFFQASVDKDPGAQGELQAAQSHCLHGLPKAE
ncbi:MAG TPA: hypothetical protein VER96_08380 [Polyangiaceae bacterium]|nr:hypothetical protein [Polyangiaceae bacterium]